MFFGNDRSALREQFFTAWQKYQAKSLLTPLESQIIAVIQDHPEYQELLNQPEQYADHDFDTEAGEINPFLHMAMHLSIRDQIQLDTPAGSRAVYERLLLTLGDPLHVEHEMMHVLTEHIWIMLKQQQGFNVSEYMERLHRL